MMKRSCTIAIRQQPRFLVGGRDLTYAAGRGSWPSVLAPKHNDRSGFTLLELMIVVAIILAVTSIVAPGMMERVRSGRVEEAADAVSTMLANARTQAIDTGVDYHFRFELNGQCFIAIPAEVGVSIGNSNNSDSETAEFSYTAANLPTTIFLRYSQNDKSGSERGRHLASLPTRERWRQRIGRCRFCFASMAVLRIRRFVSWTNSNEVVMFPCVG